MEKTNISWMDFEVDINTCISQIKNKSFDLIIGLMRGGTIPATIISNRLNIPMRTLGLKSYTSDNKQTEISLYQTCYDSIVNMLQQRKNVLIVDDLSDSGHTFQFAVDNYKYYFENVFTLAPYMKEGTSLVPDFYSKRFEKDTWLVFPWE
jgi:hypoxanthine phosphoribosyltransferase